MIKSRLTRSAWFNIIADRSRELHMRKWIKISLCLLGLCVLGVGLLWVGIRSRVEGKSQGGRSEEDIFPHVKINNRARAIVGAVISRSGCDFTKVAATE